MFHLLNNILEIHQDTGVQPGGGARAMQSALVAFLPAFKKIQQFLNASIYFFKHLQIVCNIVLFTIIFFHKSYPFFLLIKQQNYSVSFFVCSNISIWLHPCQDIFIFIFKFALYLQLLNNRNFYHIRNRKKRALQLVLGCQLYSSLLFVGLVSTYI